MKRTATKLASKLVGLKEDVATRKILKAGCAYRYVVIEGRRTRGRNSNVDNQTMCLFVSEGGVVFRVVVGSKGIYDHPDYLAAPPAPEDT